MKVVRVVEYHKPLKLDEAPDPKIDGPLDVIVKIGAVSTRSLATLFFNICGQNFNAIRPPLNDHTYRQVCVEQTFTSLKASGKQSPA